MKILKLLLALFIGLSILTCSSNDDNSSNANPNSGGFQIGDDYFSTPFAYINDENTVNENPSDLAIILSNIDILPENISSGIDYLYVDYNGVDFETGSKDLLDYRITENASRVNSIIQDGTKLLDNSNSNINATQVSFVINSFSDTNIDVAFLFTRQDGEIISGEYSGTYINVSN